MKFTIPLIICASFTLGSCSNEKLDGGDNTTPSTTEEINFNAFLKKEMTGIYLWADEVRGKAESIALEMDNRKYFDALKYAQDPWSRLTGEIFEGEQAAVDDGYDTGFGWIVTIWTVRNNVIEVKLNHVYPNTPAADAGLRRGDFITHIDGLAITDASVYSLFNTQTPITVQVRKRGATETETLTLTPRRFDINPIAVDTVLVQNNRRIGYLYYTSFVYKKDQSLPDLTALFTKFKTA
ncbi:MAG: PDZ domain-containing protein, partial [Odoribacteraceae bacterium]|nr:PDZ domain-containing protein [Odoribacteraceae bacterium]